MADIASALLLGLITGIILELLPPILAAGKVEARLELLCERRSRPSAKRWPYPCDTATRWDTVSDNES